MIGNIVIQESSAIPVADQPVEIVERKGIGHPDTICDSVAERISIALSKAYANAFGRILHYNIDKGLLVAGQVECRFGGGRVLEPMRLIIGDRAMTGVGGRTIPVADIAVGAARDWLTKHLRHVDAERHVRYQVELKPGSPELSGIFKPRSGPLVANDTSAAVGYAPLTATERLVLDLERFLNGSFKRDFPQTGEDIKVMAYRTGQDLTLTISMPLLARSIRSEAAYFNLKARAQQAISAYLRTRSPFRRVQLLLNALDRPGKGIAGAYLTLLGTSAEHGDSGQIGRGNRVCGVIALNRPMSGEAAAGKNPVSHVGKIYNVLAHELAFRIHRRVPGVREVNVWLCSTIGQRIDRPAVATTQVCLSPGTALRRVHAAIRGIIRDGLEDLPSFCEKLARGAYPIC